MKISDQKKLSSVGVKNIIFDWGGVLTNLEFPVIDKAFKKLGIDNILSLFSNDSSNALSHDFEMGRVSPQDFRDEVCKRFNSNASDVEFNWAWNTILGETPIQRIETIKKLGVKYRTFLLSNTNKIHADYYNIKLQTDYKTDHNALFEKAYYSHEMGLRKPNIEIFQQVLKEKNLIPEETLFIDDTDIHINAALQLGIRVFHLTNGLDIVDVFKDW